MASATTVRRRAMTERGSSLPITALPDTIMLAPAWRRAAWGKWIAAPRWANKEVIHTRPVFLTSAHLSMVSGPTPPSTSMFSEGNWRLSQFTWEHRRRVQVEAELNIKSGEEWNSCQAKRVRRLGGEGVKLECGVRSSQTLRERSPQTDSDLYLALVQHKFVFFSRDSGGSGEDLGYSKRRLWHFCSPGT